MLHEPISSATDHAARRPTNRSIETILARRQARLGRRKQVFPPDFVHGLAQLDEIYGVFGERWVEGAAFVEEFRDEDGELVAFTVAYFDERFLTIEQAVRDEVDDLEARLGELVGRCRSVVNLHVAVSESSRTKASRDLAVCCSLGRLLELEQSQLAVVRDKDFSDPRAIYSQRDDVLQDSRTNMLSLVCLCARLAQ